MKVRLGLQLNALLLSCILVGSISFFTAANAVTITFVKDKDGELTTGINNSGAEPGAVISIGKLDKGDFETIFPFGEYRLIGGNGKLLASFEWLGSFKGPFGSPPNTQFKLSIEDFECFQDPKVSSTTQFAIGTSNTIEFESSQSSNFTVPPDLRIVVITVPEPLTIVASGLALGFGFLCERRYAKKRRVNNQELDLIQEPG
jgi:hypothetical protein